MTMHTQKVVQRVLIKFYPEQLKQPKVGVNQYLRTLLNKYNQDMQGVPLSYRKIKVDKTYSRIFDDSPVTFLQTKVTFSVFKPKKGDVLTGTVNKCTSDHVGFLVHSQFNATVAANTLPSHVRFDLSNGTFFDTKAKQQVFELGQEAELVVQRVEFAGHGSLVLVCTLKGMPKPLEHPTSTQHADSSSSSSSSEGGDEDKSEEGTQGSGDDESEEGSEEESEQEGSSSSSDEDADDSE